AWPIVLVWMPAQVPGEVLEAIVAWRNRTERPVMLLGCAPQGELADSENALAAGFDDFMAGRGSGRELSARLRALTRRLARAAFAPTGTPDRPRFGRVTLDLAGHELWVGDQRVRLTERELALMSALLAAAGGVVGRPELLDRVWGPDALEVGPRS